MRCLQLTAREMVFRNSNRRVEVAGQAGGPSTSGNLTVSNTMIRAPLPSRDLDKLDQSPTARHSCLTAGGLRNAGAKTAGRADHPRALQHAAAILAGGV